MIYPSNSYEEKSKADKFARAFIDNNYSDEIFLFHEMKIESLSIDCVLFCEGRGVVILENMDYQASEIKEVTDNHMIKFINRPVNYTGLPKAYSNREKLIGLPLLSSISEIVIGACSYPFIDEISYKECGLGRVIPRDLVFLKEDWSNKDSFNKKIQKLFEFCLVDDKRQTSKVFDRDLIENICVNIDSKYGEAVKSYSYKEPREFDIDLHANTSKELFYGICSFLMKNGITTGFICSQSREILDGLGEYMSAVKIPWSYDGDNVNIGYIFMDGMFDEIDFPSGSVVINLIGNSSIQVVQGRSRKYNIEIHNRNRIYDNLKDIDIGNPIHLKNEQIREMFLKAFEVAESEIDIISPWMNFGVVNDSFIELMKSALARGVTIKIIYGLTPDSSEYNISRSNRSDQVAKYLKNVFVEYENQLVITRDNIHYKLVLCDEKFKLEGGYNYLSFMGDYDNKNTRKEGSPFGTQIDEIRFLRKEYFE